MKLQEAGLPNITLGWELEATHRARKTLEGIEVTHDGSVGGESLEYRVRRELVFDPMRSLAALRNLATDPFLTVDHSCGFHVHMGLGKRSRKLHEWAGWFVQLGRELEGAAFASVPETRRSNHYCRSWREHPGSVIAKEYSPSKGANGDRYNWVNCVEIFRPGGIRTIEVRLMGDCKRYTYLLAWVSVCRLMAMSAYALTSDPSRLEREREELRNAFDLIKESFLNRRSTKSAVKTALYLSSKAGLTKVFGKPLESLSKWETDLAYESDMNAQDRREYGAVMRSMRQATEEFRTRVRTEGQVPHGALLPGDTVQCVRIPNDGHLTVGSLYRVVAVDSASCTVLNDNALMWNVRNECVRLVESAREVLCAV